MTFCFEKTVGAALFGYARAYSGNHQASISLSFNLFLGDSPKHQPSSNSTPSGSTNGFFPCSRGDVLLTYPIGARGARGMSMWAPPLPPLNCAFATSFFSAVFDWKGGAPPWHPVTSLRDESDDSMFASSLSAGQRHLEDQAPTQPDR